MSDTRHKNQRWNCGTSPTFDGAQLAVLMDIRDELQTLNGVMACPNVMRGFVALVQMNRRDEASFKRRVKRAVARELRAKK